MTKFVLPDKWCIKATNDEEAEVIANYGSLVDIEGWTKSNTFHYYLHIFNDVYYAGNIQILEGYTKITFVIYVLNKTTIVEDYSYLIQLLKNINIK